MKKLIMLIGVIVIVLTVLNGCGANTESTAQEVETLAQARQNFQTSIVDKKVDDYSVDTPPEGILETVRFTSPAGELDAYITPDPQDGRKHPAIIWIVGGWSNSISSTAWELAPMDNDQSARAFREAGIVTMYPSRRGGNENQLSKECWYGEIDDIMSAYDYLSNVSYVDPDRIYLGGHSTGGSQAILTAEYTDKFRAVFSFGPKGSVKDSDSSYFTFDTKNSQEIQLRSPLLWVSSITTPTYIFEGEAGNSNFVKKYVDEAKKAEKSDLLSGYVIKDADHFSTLAPLTPLVAQKILTDTDEQVNIAFSEIELANAMDEPKIITKDFFNEGNTYRISLSGDWANYDAGNPDNLFIISLDNRFYIDANSYPADTFENMDDFLNVFNDNTLEEGDDMISDIKDIHISTATAAKQLTWVYDTTDGTLGSCLTFIQTESAFYIFSIGAYEDDYWEMEKELNAIPLTFEEVK